MDEHNHHNHDHAHLHDAEFDGFNSFLSNQFPDIIQHALVITAFVFIMMLVIEYINVQTQGLWQKRLSKNKYSQYIIAAILGLIPGCLGAYTAVALFSHKLISFGAIVTTMIATSGDEAFMMLALIPDKTLIIMGILFVVAIVAGYLSDKFFNANWITEKIKENKLPIHKEEQCKCIDEKQIIRRKFSFQRIIISVVLIILTVLVLTGIISLHNQLWMQITILLSLAFALFIVLSVPEHFLKEHLWDHIVKVHLPKIFLWVFGTLIIVGILMNFVDVKEMINENAAWVLLVSVLVGIIPQSGPHLIFLTLFVQGQIPFSILLASSISQDGHGMLPLLAESKRAFVLVKIINIIVALAVGYFAFFIGF